MRFKKQPKRISTDDHATLTAALDAARKSQTDLYDVATALHARYGLDASRGEGIAEDGSITRT